MKNIEDIHQKRWRLGFVLTFAMCVLYFGFIGLIAFDKELMGTLLIEGLSLGILLGALVIVGAWILTFIYVRWANGAFDSALSQHKTQFKQKAK